MRIYLLCNKEDSDLYSIKIYKKVGHLKSCFTINKLNPDKYKVYVLDTDNSVEDEELNKWLVKHVLKLGNLTK